MRKFFAYDSYWIIDCMKQYTNTNNKMVLVFLNTITVELDVSYREVTPFAFCLRKPIN